MKEIHNEQIIEITGQDIRSAMDMVNSLSIEEFNALADYQKSGNSITWFMNNRPDLLTEEQKQNHINNQKEPIIES